MSDTTVNRKFHGKLFLFEKSLLLTELLEKADDKKLQYRSHVLRSDLERISTDNKGFFELLIGTRTVTLYSDLIKTQEWIRLLSEGCNGK